MKSISKFCFIAATVFTLCFPSTSFSEETLRISVSSSLLDEIFNRIKAAFEKETGIKLVLRNSAKGTETYLKELLDGEADAAVAAVAYADWIKLAEKNGVKIPEGADLTHRVIGRDLLLAVAHNGSGITKLTSEQIADVLTGKVTNWKEVGGSDQAIKLYFAANKPNRRSNLQKTLLKGRDFAAQPKMIEFEIAMPKAMSADPSAFAVLAADPKITNLRVVQTPPLGRPATMVTKGRPSVAAEKLIAFIRNNQKLISGEQGTP